MASTVKHLRSSTANKRPTASGLADGQLGINTASGTPGVFFKDSAGTVVKVGPAHVGASAPNVSPAGSAGNSRGELWVNNSTTIHGLNYYTGSAFVNLTPSGTTTVAGLVELATNAETQTGTDTVRAVTPSGLQSKISDSTSTTSSTTIASATAVKAAYDLADAALPKSGGRVTGALEIGPAGSLVFEGSSDNSFETTLAVVDPTADRTITFPNVTGNVVTTGDSGTVTSAMIANGTIVNADISASAEIAVSKLADGAARQLLQTDAAGTGVEWTDNVGIPGTLDVTGATVLSGRVGIGTTDTGALVNISANTAEDALRVTQTGAGNALVVEDSANPDGTPFVIDANGRVVQGHTTALSLNGTGGTPVQQIHAATSNLFAGACYSAVNWGDTVAPAGIFIARGRSGAIGTYTIVPSGQNLGELRFAGADGVEFQNAAVIGVQVDGTPSAGIVPGSITFETANSSGTLTERMRIDSSGNVGINTTDPTGGGALPGAGKVVTIEGDLATGSRCLALAGDTGGGDLPFQVVARGDYATQKFVIYGDGSVENTNGSIGTLSDIRLKTNIAPASSQWADIKDIEVVNYDMQGEDRRMLGVVAQQVETVSPGLVVDRPKYNEQGEETDSIKGVRLSILYMKAVKALQEAMERIEILETKVAALEAP